VTDINVDELLEQLRNLVSDDDIEMLAWRAADVIEKQREYIAVYQDQTNILLNRIEELEKLLEEKK
jgi:CHASE3 domain sensor protein